MLSGGLSWLQMLYSIICMLVYLSQNAPIKCCFENIKYFTKCVPRMREM